MPTRFVIERTDNYKSENADIVNFTDVVSFEIDEQEHERELKRRNDKGEEISYNPPRFEYSYDFYAKITVNHPYFDDMRFKLNKNSIELETVGYKTGFGLTRNSFDPTLYPEYRAARTWWDTMNELFSAGMQGRQMVTGGQQPGFGTAVGYGTAPVQQPTPFAQPAPVQPTPVQPAPAAPVAVGPKFCPNCGAPAEGGKFCQSCGSPLQ